MVDFEKLKRLRQETNVSMMECKKALEKAGGDLEKAKEILRKKGMEFAIKKEASGTTEGIIESYIHNNKKIGVLLDIRCETDFVARSQEFKKLAHELALHIAAMAPRFIKADDIPEEYLDGERKIYREQFLGSGKPERLIAEIVEGKIKKLKEEISLLNQPFVKEPDKTVKELINEYIAKLGENIVIKKFVRYEI